MGFGHINGRRPSLEEIKLLKKPNPPPAPPQPRGVTDVEAALRVLKDYFAFRAIKP